MPSRDLMDIPVKTLDGLRNVTKAAREFLEASRTHKDEVPALNRLYNAVENLDAVHDGPVWECRASRSVETES